MNPPDNTKNYAVNLRENEIRIPESLPLIIDRIDDLHRDLNIVLNNELIAKNKIRKVGIVLNDLIKTQVALKEKANIINAFLTNEQERIREKTERYDSKTGFICKKVIKDLKDILKMNERTLALSRDLIQETNN